MSSCPAPPGGASPTTSTCSTALTADSAITAILAPPELAELIAPERTLGAVDLLIDAVVGGVPGHRPVRASHERGPAPRLSRRGRADPHRSLAGDGPGRL